MLYARHIPLAATAILCAYTDIARGKIYNVVTLPVLVYGLALALAVGGLGGTSAVDAAGRAHRIAGLSEALTACVLGLAVFGVVYLMGGLGGGDVKLMAAIGALAADWRFVLFAAFYGALVGAVIGVAFLIWRGQFLAGLKRSLLLFVTLGRRPGREELSLEQTFPYGLAIAIGCLWAMYGFVFAPGAA